MNTSLKSRLRLFVFLAGILAKFWLIAQSEIIDDRDDSHEYALQILHPINGGLDYGPGTGWVGGLFRDVGLPFRLGIEILFVVALVLTLKALFEWPHRSWLSLGLFLFTIFDPALADLFAHLYSDQVWLVETMAGFSLLVLALRESPPNWRLLVLSAICLGISTVTRSISIPLVLAFAFFVTGSVALIFGHFREKERTTALGAFVLSIVTLGLGIGIIHQGTCAFNSRCHGYNGISVVDNPALKKFYFCLQSVGAPDGKPYFAIDENRRRQIAQAGPVANAFIAEMEKQDFVKNMGLVHYGTSDIPSSWVLYSFYNASLPGADNDLRKCFAEFEKIEGEIARAGQSGAIKVRPILPLPDCRFAIVWTVFPTGLHSVFREIVAEPTVSAFAWNPQLYQDLDFTQAVTRRTVVASPVREGIWGMLCDVYSIVYSPFFLYVYLVGWLGLMVLAIARWKRLGVQPLHWMAQQLFGFLFVILVFWYALFDASGWPVAFRYMVYNHVMLPILIASGGVTIARLLQREVGL